MYELNLTSARIVYGGIFMAYKIEYTPDYVRKDLTALRIRSVSRIVMLAGMAVFACLLLHNREYVVYALEKVALQLRDGEAAWDAVSAFCETLQGSFGG